jgi:hypothetical protein
MEKVFTPQQGTGLPGLRPPRGWVPPLGAQLTLLGVYDNASGYWVGLPLQALVEALIAAESLHTEDRIDERDKIEVTIPGGTAQDTVKTKEFEIPGGEVWYLNSFELVTPLEVSGNIRISKFPKVDGVDKKYLGTDQEPGSGITYIMKEDGQLGADLRLVGGDKLTVVATVTAAGGTTVDRTVTLNLFGRKARRLV